MKEKGVLQFSFDKGMDKGMLVLDVTDVSFVRRLSSVTFTSANARWGAHSNVKTNTFEIRN